MIAIKWNYTEEIGGQTEHKHESAMVETQDELEDMLKIINEEFEYRINNEDYGCKVGSIEYFQCTKVDNPCEFLQLVDGGIQ